MLQKDVINELENVLGELRSIAAAGDIDRLVSTVEPPLIEVIRSLRVSNSVKQALITYVRTLDDVVTSVL